MPRSLTFQQRRELAQTLRSIPLDQVLPLVGAQPDRFDHHKWHTPRGDLSITGPKFMNWHLDCGGGGAIDLVIHVLELDFKDALDWLAIHFPDAPQPVAPIPPRSNIQLPLQDPDQLARVTNYLINHRRLPAALLYPLIESGSLYADARANAVFLMHDSHNLPVGAELRGSSFSCWRGMAPGSRKDLGFFSIPTHPMPSIILCESAIDAISCFALHPTHRCLSTAGARPNPSWLPLIIASASHVLCAFDSDPTGDAMAQFLISQHPSVQRLRPPLKDWNDVLRSHS